MVADLWCLDSASWKTSLIFELFEEASATAILQLPPPRRMGDDVALWLLSPDSVFTVKNAYSEVIRDRSPLLPILSPADWKSFWRLKLPDRLKTFFVEGDLEFSPNSFTVVSLHAGTAFKFQYLSGVWCG